MSDAPTPKPPLAVDLIWEHDLVLAGRSSGMGMTLDSAGTEGPSPMQTLAFALAGCMSMDVIHVIKKGRHDLRGLKAELIGQRAQTEPRRFTSITLHFTITGDPPAGVVDRAIQLSRDKYCSVWQSMRQDIELEVTYKVAPGV